MKKENKEEFSAVRQQKEFEKAHSIMESIADASISDYEMEDEDEFLDEFETEDGGANWETLTDVTLPDQDETFTPRFGTVEDDLDDDDKIAVSGELMKYIQNSNSNYFNVNQIPSITTVIANDKGLSPVAVDKYISELISSSANFRDSQGAATSGGLSSNAQQTTVPDTGEFPSDSVFDETGSEDIGGVEDVDLSTELDESNFNIDAEFEEDSDLGMDDVSVEEEAEVVGDDLGEVDELDELDGELDAALDELSNDLDSDVAEDDVEVAVDEEPIGDLESNEIDVDDNNVEDDEVKVDGDEEDEEEDLDDMEMFEESLSAKKQKLAALVESFQKKESSIAMLESLKAKYSSLLEGSKEKAADTLKMADDALAGLGVDSKKADVSVDVDDVKVEDDDNGEDDVDEQVVAKLESIAANLNKKYADVESEKAIKAKLESIVDSVKEKKAIQEAATKKELELKVKLESIADRAKSRSAILESQDIATSVSDTDRDDKIKALRAKFESSIQAKIEKL